MSTTSPYDIWTTLNQLKEPLASAVRTLEEDIIFGRLRPRQRLIEDILMERFGIKRHVARQALIVLEQLGIVTREPNKGARVREFSPEEISQIYDVRFLLQAHAARLIPLPVDASLLERLRATHAQHCRAMETGDLALIYRYDNEFHDLIFEACGNPYLSDTIKRYASLAHAIRAYRLSDPALLGQSKDEHGQMIDALDLGDRELLVHLCTEHIKPSIRAYLATEKGTEEA